jgi:hypothetical protein
VAQVSDAADAQRRLPSRIARIGHRDGVVAGFEVTVQVVERDQANGDRATGLRWQAERQHGHSKQQPQRGQTRFRHRKMGVFGDPARLYCAWRWRRLALSCRSPFLRVRCGRRQETVAAPGCVRGLGGEEEAIATVRLLHCRP